MLVSAVVCSVRRSKSIIYLSDGVMSKGEANVGLRNVYRVWVSGYIWIDDPVAEALVLLQPEFHSTVAEACFDG